MHKYKLSISHEFIKLSNGVKLGPHIITKFFLIAGLPPSPSLLFENINKQSSSKLSLVITLICSELGFFIKELILKYFLLLKISL